MYVCMYVCYYTLTNHLYYTYMQIQVDYMTPRKYVISPTRNRMVKAVARESRMTVAKKVLTDPVTKKHVVEMLGKELASEVRSMASDGANSILQSLNTRHLKNFHGTC